MLCIYEIFTIGEKLLLVRQYICRFYWDHPRMHWNVRDYCSCDHTVLYMISSCCNLIVKKTARLCSRSHGEGRIIARAARLMPSPFCAICHSPSLGKKKKGAECDCHVQRDTPSMSPTSHDEQRVHHAMMAFHNPVRFNFSIHDFILLPDAGRGKLSHMAITIAESLPLSKLTVLNLSWGLSSLSHSGMVESSFET